LYVRKVEKTSKCDFLEKTFLGVFRCEESESEVRWVIVGRGRLRGVERKVKKTSKCDFLEKTFLGVF
jgi:hypothetical protein